MISKNDTSVLGRSRGVTARVLSRSEDIERLRKQGTYANVIRKLSSDVHVRDAGVNVEFHRLPLVHKHLLQQHPPGLACFDICVRNKKSVGPVVYFPTDAQTFFFWGSKLDEDEALAWDFLFVSST
jgi:hypothetical protein